MILFDIYLFIKNLNIYKINLSVYKKSKIEMNNKSLCDRSIKT